MVLFHLLLLLVSGDNSSYVNINQWPSLNKELEPHSKADWHRLLVLDTTPLCQRVLARSFSPVILFLYPMSSLFENLHLTPHNATKSNIEALRSPIPIADMDFSLVLEISLELFLLVLSVYLVFMSMTAVCVTCAVSTIARRRVKP